MVVKLRRSSVEIAEFLQGVGRAHGDDTTTTIADKYDGPPPRVRTVLGSSRRPHDSRMITDERDAVQVLSMSWREVVIRRLPGAEWVVTR